MKIPDDLKQFNLVGPSKPARRRLVMTGDGGPGTGKTDFFYRTFPRPALVIQLDQNDQGLRERYSDDEDLFIKDVIVPPFVIHDEATRVRDMEIAQEIRNLYITSVNKNYFRSIMIDEGKALYELARRAFLVSLDFGGAAQSSYAPINAYMARFFTLAKQKRINLYIPHRQKDEREDTFTQAGKKTSVQTGKKVVAGWKDALYESQCHVIFDKDVTYDLNLCAVCDESRKNCTCDKFRKRNPADKFSMTVTKCSDQTSIEGRVFKGDEIDLSILGQAIYPLSSDKDWQS